MNDPQQAKNEVLTNSLDQVLLMRGKTFMTCAPVLLSDVDANFNFKLRKVLS